MSIVVNRRRLQPNTKYNQISEVVNDWYNSSEISSVVLIESLSSERFLLSISHEVRIMFKKLQSIIVRLALDEEDDSEDDAAFFMDVKNVAYRLVRIMTAVIPNKRGDYATKKTYSVMITNLLYYYFGSKKHCFELIQCIVDMLVAYIIYLRIFLGDDAYVFDIAKFQNANDFAYEVEKSLLKTTVTGGDDLNVVLNTNIRLLAVWLQNVTYLLSEIKDDKSLTDEIRFMVDTVSANLDEAVMRTTTMRNKINGMVSCTECDRATKQCKCGGGRKVRLVLGRSLRVTLNNFPSVLAKIS
jgi:hypothetical protein